MASVHKETLVAASVERVWEAIRDVGAIHTRLAPGFVVDTRVEGDSRVVTFGNGSVARERFVDLDEAARRLAYSIVEGRFTHHNASIQVFPEGDGASRVVWIADLLPDEFAELVGGMMEAGSLAMKTTLEGAAMGAVSG